MSILDNINPFKKDVSDFVETDKEKVGKSAKDLPVNPHETGGCCGGCGGLEEKNE